MNRLATAALSLVVLSGCCAPADASRLTKHVDDLDPILWRVDEERLIAGVIPVGFFGSTSDVFKSFDFTTTSLPSGASCSRSGTATAYAARSASTYASTGSTTCIYEDRGEAVPGGWWAFRGYTNQLSPFTPTGAGWTNLNTSATAAGSVTCPDGTTGNAYTIAVTSTGGGQAETYYSLSNGAADGVLTAWVKNNVGNAPINPLFGIDATGSGYAAFDFTDANASGSWRRVAWGSHSADYGCSGPVWWLSPSNTGSNYTTPANGAVDLCGASLVSEVVNTTAYNHIYALSDLPLINGTTGAQVVSLSSPGQLVQNGDLDVEISFVPAAFRSYDWQYGNGDGTTHAYFIGGTSADGAYGVRWDDMSAGQFVLTVRGVDVLTIGSNTGMAFPNSLNTLTAGGSGGQSFVGSGSLPQEMTIRAWYKPNSTHQGGIAITINGATQQIDTVATTGTALAAPTTAYLLSKDGTQNYFNGRITRFRIYKSTATNGMPSVAGVALGDSLTRSGPRYVSVPSYIWTANEIRSGAHRPIAIIAVGGDTCEGQLTKWQASPYRGNSATKWVYDQCGVNNIPADYSANGNVVSTTTQAIRNKIQANITDIATNNPTAKIIRGCITPAFAYWNTTYGATPAADMETIRKALNDCISGGGAGLCAAQGASVITGTHATVCGYNTTLTDVDGKSLKAQYNLDTLNGTYVSGGDGIHYSDEARATVLAPAYRTALTGFGF